jgi:predicted nucleotidyltransferase
MTLVVPTWAGQIVAEQPYPMIFTTVSGAHLYGFASVDSDLDLRGMHTLPATEVVGLHTGPDTITSDSVRDGVELDLVSHDLLKFARLLLNRNGYVLEQLLSPLLVHTTDVHAELISLVPGLLTRHHAHHYLGFATTQERLAAKTGELKPALYTLRVLLTGLHLMRTGEILCDLGTLHTTHPDLGHVPDLIAAKRDAEHGTFPDAARDTLTRDVPRLRAALEAARDASHLPEHTDPATAAALHDLVVRVRLGLTDRPGLTDQAAPTPG